MTLMARLRRTLSGHKTAPAPDHSTAGKRAGLTEDQRASWERFGFVILPAFFASDDLHALRRELDQLWQERRADDRGLVIDVFIDAPNERRMRFRDAPDEARMVPYKLNDLYLASASVKETVLDPDLLTILDSLLDGEPVVCNSLTFERGSQQRFHFDTFYMPPLVENKMLATWIALEDCSAAAGPLRYYPGSHKIAPYRFSDGRLNASPDEMGDFDEYIDKQIADAGLDWTSFCAKAGDVFIWHAQLYHGGAPIEDITLTRHSLVTHYFRAEDVDACSVDDIGGARFVLRREHQHVD